MDSNTTEKEIENPSNIIEKEQIPIVAEAEHEQLSTPLPLTSSTTEAAVANESVTVSQ